MVLILLAILLLTSSAIAADRPPVYPKAQPLDNRLCRMETRPGGPVTGDPAPWVDWVAKAGTDLWVFSALEGVGNVNYRSSVGYPSGDFDPEYIPKLLKLAHEKDIAVISWFMPLCCKGASEAHPEWRQVFLDNPAQAPVKEADSWYLCPNNPEVRKFIKTEIAEVVGPLGFDGIWFDGTVFGSMATIPFRVGCKCSHCTAKYKTDTGFDIPQKVDLNDENFRRFIRWRYQVMDDYMFELYQAIKAANPKAQVNVGNYYRPGHGWDTGTYMAPQKFPGTVSGENNIIGDRAYETVNVGFNGRLMKAINPYSFELWRPMWDFQIGWLPEPEPVQTTVALLLQFAQGGQSFCGYGGTGSAVTKSLTPAYSELKRRAKWHGGEPLYYAAIHYSQRARDFAYSGGAPEYDKVASGIHEILAESHVIFDYVLDGQLTLDSLKRFRVVILPESGCINEQEAKALREYVEQGGRLIATGETSLYDGLGNKRPDFLLADLFGVHYTASQPYPNYPKTSPVGVLADNDMLKALPRSVWFMSPYCDVKINPASNAQLTIWRTEYNEAASLDEDKVPATDIPLAVTRKVGKGEVVYLAADIGRGYAENPFQRMRKLLAYWTDQAGPWLKIEAPKVVEATAFKKNGETIIHLVNSPITTIRPTVMWQRMPLVDEIVPVTDLKVSIKGDFKSARLEPSGINLRIKKLEGWSEVTVPKVDIHEMVVWK